MRFRYLSRRRFLQSATATAAVGAGFAPARAEPTVDVAIIGAGATGLAAAQSLLALGYTIRVLEAGRAKGGRVWTSLATGAPTDMGAALVHWAESNPWFDVAQLHGIPLEPVNTDARSATYAGRSLLSKPAAEQRTAEFAELWRKLAGFREPDRSLASLIGERSQFAARELTWFSLGEEPERVSTVDYLGLRSGSDRRAPGGYGALLHAFASNIPVSTEAPVSEIRVGRDRVEVTTAQGSVTARAAVLTVSVGVLRAGQIRIVPGLPTTFQRALDAVSMGALTRAALRIDHPVISRIDLDNMLVLVGSEGAISYDFSLAKHGVVTAVFGGDFARKLLASPSRDVVAFLSGRLAACLGVDFRSAVRQSVIGDWWHNPMTRGSYSIVAPGSANARAALAEPMFERLLYAGEATSGDGATTAGGAFLEGMRAARRVDQILA